MLAIGNLKVCSNKLCKNENPQDISNFNKNKVKEDGLSNYCKECSREITRKYQDNDDVRKLKREAIARARKENPEKFKEYKRIQRLKNPEKFRRDRYSSTLKIRYGISISDYEEISKKQNHKCKICGKTCEELKRMTGKRLVIDHDHDTKKIRGLLCIECNLGLGYFKDDAILLLNCIDYLKEAKNG